jgi:predicted outer membrane repeat protein
MFMVRTFWQRLIQAASHTPSRRSRTSRLSLEILEDRLVPSTFLVTNASDNLQPGSLRYAVAQANLPGNNNSTIEFTPQVAGPIVLSLGELSINANTTIQNDSGAALEIRQSTPNARVLQVGSNASAVTLTGGPGSAITLDGGTAGGNGGGILVDNSSTVLTLNFVQVVSNSAGGSGGGIYSAGSVILNGSSVSGNRASNGFGGGIVVQLGTVSLNDGSHVNDNTAKDVGGIEVDNVPQPPDNAVSVTGGSTVNGNSSTATVNPFAGDFGGGGIAVELFGNVYVSASQVSDNHTVGMYSGGIVVALGSVTVTDGSQVDGNTNNGPGGGIAANFLGTVTVSGGSQVDGNTGGAIGGGIVNFAGPLGGVVVTGGSQVDDNVLTNGESLGQALAVFAAVVYAPPTLDRIATALNGPEGSALLAALPQIQGEANLYMQIAAAPSGVPGFLTAGGGIGTLLAPITIDGGSEVDGNLCGQRIAGGNPQSVGVGGGLFSLFGPIAVSDSAIEYNRAPYGNGGGIAGWLGAVMLDRAVVANNSAALNGGDIWCGGSLFANSSTVSGDAAGWEGGGLFNAGLAFFLNSTIHDNHAMLGGGIANQGTLTLLGSNVTTNTALLFGGGIANNHNGSLLPINTLIAANDPNNIAWY